MIRSMPWSFPCCRGRSAHRASTRATRRSAKQRLTALGVAEGHIDNHDETSAGRAAGEIGMFGGFEKLFGPLRHLRLRRGPAPRAHPAQRQGRRGARHHGRPDGLKSHGGPAGDSPFVTPGPDCWGLARAHETRYCVLTDRMDGQ